MLTRGKGYALGLSSVIFAIGFFVLPIVFIKPSFFMIPDMVLSYIRILWVLFPAIAFVLAFIGKVKSKRATKARRLCNIGAGIGWIASVVLMFTGFGSLWMDVFSISAVAAEVTCLVDTILISGYFLIAYIRGKILWFI